MGNSKQEKSIYRVENFEEIQEIIIDKSQSLYDYINIKAVSIFSTIKC